MKHHLPPAVQRQLCAHLRRGGLIAYPTESVYGLGCLPQHPIALRRLMQLKQRPQHKGLIIIGANETQLQPLLQPLQAPHRELTARWPAPLTLLLPAAPHIPILLRGRNRTQLAVRVPDHPLARAICHSLASPLVSTSCNKSRQRPCRTERETRRRFGRHVLILRGRCGQQRQPSRIIDADTGQILR